MELKDLTLALRRHWLAALVAFLLCCGAGVSSVLRTEDRYSATSVAAVLPAPEATASDQNVVQMAA